MTRLIILTKIKDYYGEVILIKTITNQIKTQYSFLYSFELRKKLIKEMNEKKSHEILKETLYNLEKWTVELTKEEVENYEKLNKTIKRNNISIEQGIVELLINKNIKNIYI